MSEHSARAGVLARNSFANLIRVASTSLVALAMPIVLVAILRPNLYSEWALLFGLAGFVLYLDFGLPASVQTLVSRALAQHRTGEAKSRAVSGVAWASVIGAVMLVALLAVGAGARTLFPSLPPGDDARISFVITLVGLGNIATFVGNTASAYFAGQQRSGLPALVLVPGRVASLVLATTFAAITQDLVLVATVYAVPLVAGGVAMVIAVLGSRAHDASAVSDRSAVLRFSGPLAAWSVYMLCISGAGIVIVGRVDFRAVAVFSLAAAFSSSLTGVLSALISPMLSELGRNHEDRARFTEVTATGTRVTVAFVVLGVVGIEGIYLVASGFLQQAQAVPGWEAALIVAFTVLAGGVRLTMTPLTYAFVASGSHRKLLLPPLGEAVATLAATIGLGVAFGGTGVAAGLLLGASVGVLIALIWSHRVTGVVDFSSRELAHVALVRPLAALAPAQILFLVVALASGGVLGLAVSVPIALAMVLSAALLAWLLCLPRSLRHGLLDGLRRRVPLPVRP